MVKDRTYEPETLRRLQLVELEIFKDFAAICEKHEIPYFVSGGTAIGALRHGGFIPWDDDMDVGIPCEHYDRFMAIAEKELSDRYCLMCPERTKNFPTPNMQITKKGTVFRPMCYKTLKCDLGIFLDVFRYDHTTQDVALRKKQIREAWFWAKLYILRHIAFPVIPFKGIKGYIAKALCACIHVFLVAFRISKKYIYRRYYEVATRYNNMDTELYADFQYTFPEKVIISEDEIYPLRKVIFEDTQVNVLNKAEDYLNRQFDDFMQLPPADKRKNHFPFELNFGDSDE